MKNGYVVWNNSNYDNEFFGVYRSHKRAEACLRRVIRNRFGKCPRDLESLVEEPYSEGGDSSYGITYFEEYKGE